MRILCAALIFLALAFAGGCAAPSGASRQNVALRRELLAMYEVDQKVLQGFGPQMSAEIVAGIQAAGAKHVAWMKIIIAQSGWPGRSLVGDDGAHAA